MAAAPFRSRHSPVPRDQRDSAEQDDIFDTVDVPAAVVCALCGQADCLGCEHEPTRSGVVAIVAWERPGAPFFGRLWLTARGTTRTPQQFFEGLPDGPVLPALRFALTCELLATLAMIVTALPLVAFAAPRWLRHLALDGPARDAAGRALVVGVPAFAALLVVAHVAHGLALDRGARRSGGSPARVDGIASALRFGLYSAGWDLVLGPIGVVVVAVGEGFRPVFALLTDAVGLPGRAARAFLAGTYRLQGPAAARALGFSAVVAAIVTLVGAVVVLVGLVAITML